MIDVIELKKQKVEYENQIRLTIELKKKFQLIDIVHALDRVINKYKHIIGE